MNTLFLLIAGHFLCDYPLQGDFLAKGKNHRSPIPGFPAWQLLTAHCAIQAGMVALLTGSWILGLCEFGAHFLTDYAKCDERINFNEDQFIHLTCKLAWWTVWYLSLRP